MNSTSTTAFDFGLPVPDRRPITIRTTRSMFLRRIDGKDLVHIESGGVVTITMHDLGMLGPGDWMPVEP